MSAVLKATPPPLRQASLDAARCALSARGVSRRFRIAGTDLVALAGVDLDVAAGEFVTILGASGCGKSTLLRLFAGLDRADTGTLLHAGVPIAGPSLQRGLVFQEPRLFPWLTVTQNVATALLNAPGGPEAKRLAVAEHIALVGLAGFEDAWPHQLSGGMAQRAAIARGLVNGPDVLLMDEPFGALDALTRARLQRELRRIWERERTTMLLVTHDVDEALLLGTRLVVMTPRPGRIARILDLPRSITRDHADPAFARLRAEVLAMLDDGISTEGPLQP
ncbi:sulfonate transport system ATP-binding protein [Humitalea rosea]|uniref:Sulfonate transport system ATP-binding protein n=1 Tax=Humitalea rosea TaxID=990373 RepID=A0A2W7IVN5_9PROT|nr:ABC transporter ATP-binding protein [Humitalea rosea]PZW50828.1 sulfonate transport system ATP-binding protein [Humitalea rosea]